MIQDIHLLLLRGDSGTRNRPPSWKSDLKPLAALIGDQSLSQASALWQPEREFIASTVVAEPNFPNHYYRTACQCLECAFRHTVGLRRDRLRVAELNGGIHLAKDVCVRT